MGAGQTVLMQYTENADQTSGPDRPRALWSFTGLLIEGPVKPCAVVDDPAWDDLGGPEGQPPASS
ncbi:hypothetical protein ACIBEJ_31355 [Nonomuraea sp. NPDC050790]|uniref:hypothetical protein n=1 Tax=Nonomuraea sp. NPDC050790 TaxID=3364371 RepID=UPI00379A34DA